MEQDEINDRHRLEEAIQLMEYNELNSIPCCSNSLPPSSPLDDGIPTSAPPDDGIPPSAPPDDGIPTSASPDDGIPTSASPDDGVPISAPPDYGIPIPEPPDDDQNKPSGQTKWWNPFWADSAEMLPTILVRSFKKPKRERPNPFRTNPFSSMSLLPMTDKKYFLKSPKNGMETCKSIAQGDKITQLDIKEPLSSCETSNDSQTSTFKLEDVMELPDPPEVLDAIDAKRQIEARLKLNTDENLSKPTPAVLTLPEKLLMDLNQLQLDFIEYIDQENAILLADLIKRKGKTIQTNIRGVQTFQSLEVPRNSPEKVINTREETEDSCDNVYSATEDGVDHVDFSERETLSYVYNIGKGDGLKQLPKATMNKKSKKYNYVMVEPQENEANNSSKSANKTKFRPIIRKIPINECLTFGKIQVFKFGISHSINLLLSLFDAFDNKELLSKSETYQVTLESNIMECINTLISFIGNHHERDKLMMQANKGNIFVEAKEKKYNAVFDGKKKKTYNKLSPKDLEKIQQRPLPIPAHNTNRSKCPSVESTQKSVGTQVEFTAVVKKKSMIIPKIIVTKPSPCPSPCPSPKFNAKYKGGLKDCGSNGNKPNPNESENTTAYFEPLEPQGKAMRSIAEKSGFHSFQFHNDSFSPFEVPKRKMPLGTKSLSTTNLSDKVPTHGEADILTKSVNSMSTVTNDIFYTDFTKQNKSSENKERANQTSPIYWIQNKKNTEVKANTFGSFLKKVSKPFKKSKNVDKKDIPLKTFFANHGRVKSAEKEYEGISETEQLGTASGNALISSSGRILQVPSLEEGAKRNRRFESWVEAEIDLIRAKRSQSYLADNKSNTDIALGFKNLTYQ